MAMAERAKLLLDEAPLLVLPTLAVCLGLYEAIALQQLHYWLQKVSGHVREGRRWVYNSYEQWQQQFPFWSVATVKRVFLSLERQGVVSRPFEKGAWDRRKWYGIDNRRLAQLLNQVYPERQISSLRWEQPALIEERGLSHSMGAICATLEAEITHETTPDNSSSTAAAASAADGAGDPSAQDLPTDGTQPGELHPDVVAIIQSMVVTVFHSLAQPTKANEDFWHAMIALVNTQERRSFEEIIRDVDAYYAAHPAKIPRSQEAAMASMAFGIKFALDKAQRRRQR